MTTFKVNILHNKGVKVLQMKKFSLAINLLMLSSMFFLPLSTLEAGGCSSQKNKNYESKCLGTEKDCSDINSKKSQIKVEA